MQDVCETQQHFKMQMQTLHFPHELGDVCSSHRERLTGTLPLPPPSGAWCLAATTPAVLFLLLYAQRQLQFALGQVP